MDPQNPSFEDMLDPAGNIDPSFERLEIAVSHTQHPAANLNQITAAGSQNDMGFPGFRQNHQENPPQDRPEERRMSPNSSTYYSTFLPEHQLLAADITQHLLSPLCDISMVNFGLGHRGSCACRFPGNDRRPVVPKIPSHPPVVIDKQSYYVPPHVVDGYDHEKALLVWSTSKVYIEEARLAKTNQDRITETRNAEKAKIEMTRKILAETRKGKRAVAMGRVRRLRAMGIENRAAERRQIEMKEAEEGVTDLAVGNELTGVAAKKYTGAKMRMDTCI